ncbi:MAG: CocE/NonD family hydrolase C-terminal non-catalytic domain-containing protein, partial [Planctomycetota bacterium]
MNENQDRISGDYNDFWAGRDYLNDLEPLKAAVFMVHAFNDWNVVPEHSVRIYDAIKQKDVPRMIYFHQGGHGGPPPMSMMNRWFTRYLYGIDNGVEDDPKSWVVREGERRDNPTSYPEYPHPDASPVALYPNSGGQKSGVLSTQQTKNQGTEEVVDNVSFSSADLAKASESNHRLLYATEELAEPLHISGTATLKLRLACDKEAANLSAWIVSLPWTDPSEGTRGRITDNIITRGWADPQNRESMRESEPLEPGKFYDVEFALQPDDQVIPAGARIGLMIMSSDKDFTLHPDPGTRLTIDLDQTVLHLPIVGGSKSFDNATAQ